MAISSNRNYAINVLRFWWNATPMAELQLSTFQDFLAYFERTHPSFMEEFGRAAKNVSIDKARMGMEKLAREFGTQYPDVSSFFNALGQSAQTWNSDDTNAVVRGVVSDVQGSLQFGIGAAIVVGAVLTGVWAWKAFGGAPQRAGA